MWIGLCQIVFLVEKCLVCFQCTHDDGYSGETKVVAYFKVTNKSTG